jgi:hypothetical protein
MLVKTLKWPVISLLITGGVHFMAEAILPDLKNVFLPSVVGPVLLAFGIWAGYKTIELGGTYGNAILSGVILGILPVVLDVVGFGIILGRGVSTGFVLGVFGFCMVLFGSLIGSGFALSKN